MADVRRRVLVRAGAGALALVLLLGTAGEAAGAGPGSTHSYCPAGDAPAQSAGPEEFGRGLEEFMKAGKSYKRYFTAVAVCGEKSSASVFRVPASREFDAALRRVAARRHIWLVLVDTRYSRSALNVVEQKILGREALLAEHGVRLMSFSMPPEGYLDVGVQGSIPAARRILADFADQISVRRGHPSIPA